MARQKRTRVTGHDLVTFGKYKGLPAERLRADQSYSDHLITQQWFRRKHPDLYEYIKQGRPSAASPEHNEMQMAFQNDGRCLRLAQLLWPDRRFYVTPDDVPPDITELCRRFWNHLTFTQREASISNREFEAEGWDVVYTPMPPRGLIEPVSLPECTCVCDHSNCHKRARCRGGKGWCPHTGHNEERQFLSPDRWRSHCHDGCPWQDKAVAEFLLRKHEVQPAWDVGGRAITLLDALSQPKRRRRRPLELGPRGAVLVEVKPDLGDDYPKVLRQINDYGRGPADRICLIVRRAAFERVAWDQVKELFAASNVTLLREAELDADHERPDG